MPQFFCVDLEHGFHRRQFGSLLPLSFFELRYARCPLRVLAFGARSRAIWSARRSQWLHLAVTGVLMRTGYLGVWLP
jgi:hypothetical protein